MTHQELCDALVKDGILRDCNNYAEGYYSLPGEAAMDPFKGSNLWRVAGACLERIGEDDIAVLLAHAGSLKVFKDPRAIITAYVESLDG